MSFTKEEILKALKEKQITNLDELVKAAVDAKADSAKAANAVFIHPNYVVTD